jgi:signal transduction histidine kinase
MGARSRGVYAARVIRTVLRPWTSPGTWWGLVQLCTGVLAGMVTTVFVFAAAVTILSIAIVVPLALVGVWLLFVLGHGMARFERARYRQFCSVELVSPDPPLEPGSLWRRLVERLRMRGRWWELLYLLLRLPVSVVLFTIASTVWSVSFALLTLPAYIGWLPAASIDVRLFQVDDGAAAWLVALVGVVLFAVVAPWTTRALTHADVAFGRKLLAHGVASEMEQTVVRLESSRVAALDSAEAERRRIERDLHDGAQQRLIAAAMDLGVARERLVTDPPAGRTLVASAHDEVKAALRELRDLVRGIHPVILEDRGLDAALSAVVARSAVPVRLDVHTDPRPSPAVESAAYFIVCEALTNITRHAAATAASVSIVADAGVLRLHVHDDGRGGADPDLGTGLVGLAERVSALGGILSIESPPGGPTDLRVELPCAS